jgi:hypothetical protein
VFYVVDVTGLLKWLIDGVDLLLSGGITDILFGYLGIYDAWQCV